MPWRATVGRDAQRRAIVPAGPANLTRVSRSPLTQGRQARRARRHRARCLRAGRGGYLLLRQGNCAMLAASN